MSQTRPTVAGTASHMIPTGTPLAVETDQALAMRIGTPVRAHTLYPVYSGDTLLLPAQTTILGSIVDLRPDRSRRIRGRLHLDFTPFHTPVVRFTKVQLSDGSMLPLVSGDAVDGAPIFRIVPRPPHMAGFVHQQIDNGNQIFHDQSAVFTGPDKKDHLIQSLYSRLPYHPQRVPKGTAWTVETTEPVSLAQLPTSLPKVPTLVPASSGATTWVVQAHLNEALSSATAQTGQDIKATVDEPAFNPDGTVAIPQGATLTGIVTRSRPARRLGRAGALSFNFRQLVLPDGEEKSVQTILNGADTAASADLSLGPEGEVKPKPQDKVVVPLILLALAASPQHDDEEGDTFTGNALASNSLGVIGFVVGTAAQTPNLAAGFGFYGAALSIYDRWIARGKQVTFARDTRIVLQTTGRRNKPIAPVASTR